jgi:hypothetical protein
MRRHLRLTSCPIWRVAWLLLPVGRAVRIHWSASRSAVKIDQRRGGESKAHLARHQPLGHRRMPQTCRRRVVAMTKSHAVQEAKNLIVGAISIGGKIWPNVNTSA